LRRTRGAVLLALVLGAVPPAWSAGPAAGTFDHGPFDALLRQHVRDGRVDYDAFARAATFPRYLEALSGADPARLDSKDRLAFWINAYNAYTIHLINSHGERESIRNINKTLGVVKAKGPWQQEIVKAGGRVLSLDHVEHEIIRKEWNEARIHFALVCAAIGCPPLRPEAYTGARLEAQLQDQARLFLLQSPEKNRVDVAARTVYLNMIFEYYKEDFGTTDAAIGRYVASFHPPGPARDLLESGQFKVIKTDYDWRLNKLR
jgi:hypothetical protein